MIKNTDISQQIIHKIIKNYGLRSLEQMNSRKQEIADLKTILCYTLRQMDLPVITIGDKLNMHYTTVLHHIKKHNALVNDKKYKQRLNTALFQK
jgi:hypothetical protein